MSYSCTDFTDGVLDAFASPRHKWITKRIPDDNPSKQADLVFEAMDKVQAKLDAAKARDKAFRKAMRRALVYCQNDLTTKRLFAEAMAIKP